MISVTPGNEAIFLSPRSQGAEVDLGSNAAGRASIGKSSPTFLRGQENDCVIGIANSSQLERRLSAMGL